MLFNTTFYVCVECFLVRGAVGVLSLGTLVPEKGACLSWCGMVPLSTDDLSRGLGQDPKC